MIIETVVSTLDQAGEPNFAAMGMVWGDEMITIRPFTNTRTYKNLTQSGEAVVNVTDNVLIFAKSALSRERFESLPARHVKGLILKDTCFWREVKVEQVRTPTPADGAPVRADILTRVVGCGEVRQFSGLCRAKHAVVEASILASRLRWIGGEEILREMERLDILVEKTGGPEERQAMDFIRAHVARKTP
ncbi:MAG TPA: DUF447 domain-containing protein [Candidatus Methylomirabilis sp.]|nr:DUF447 domain-containing protein [Candidatus Methylomirabilis sp.]HSC70521.1 DUF447 domain-containing protein [Candidatus Methylomirabilis sp.]